MRKTAVSVFIQLNLEKMDSFDFSQAPKIIAHGRTMAEKNIEKIIALVQK